MNAITKLIIKNRILRKVFRSFVTIDSADALVTSFTGKFEAVAAEQAQNAKDAQARVRKAKHEQLAAEEEQKRNEVAATNLKNLLTKPVDSE